ncbi:MAG: hypothetical protein WCI71_02555 [Bacteroidota bacterium]
MEHTNISVLNKHQVTDKAGGNDSFNVRFNDEDIEALAHYTYDMGYLLEPEIPADNHEHPLRFKIISRTNPTAYGWISKVLELNDDMWQESYLYGFYKKGRYFNKYPITFAINSYQMRRILKRKAEENHRLITYFRTVFGIMDLEPPVSLLEFVFSWLYACKIIKHQHT